ncbi:DUF6127 family protein [uncultured Amaricoccus sp.]|uniref:DUF6127 family protein n=1 Tax=uncultured Amaricoccus sp. TaxID=339341 RepID=UPI00345D0D5B
MLGRAAEEYGRRALSDVGLGGKDVALPIQDARSLLERIQYVRRTAAKVECWWCSSRVTSPPRSEAEPAIGRQTLAPNLSKLPFGYRQA